MTQPLSSTDPIASAAQFARVKHECEMLLALAAAERTSARRALAARDPVLADAVDELLDHLDERDLVSAQASADVGTCIGPFRLLSLIGRGGMGEVFLAERFAAQFDQQVAVKLLRPLAGSADARRRFLHERQLLARLQHIGIAKLFDGGITEDGRPWLAMEYIQGLSLLRHAEDRGLDLRARIVLMRGVCAAVAYAHRNLIVHRDLKPGNILVDREGQPRLLDFGIAKLLDDDQIDQTQTEQRAMTLRYAAPEQLAGARTSTAMDIYALGVILFELVSGGWAQTRSEADTTRLPGATPPRLGTRLPADWKASRSLRRRIVGDLDRIVQKAAARDPLDRYDSVAALDTDIEDWLAERPLRSGIGSAGAQTRYLLSRYRWPLTTAAVVLLSVLLAALMVWQQARESRNQAAIAHTHLAALLDVLGSANPRKFSGRDPTASEFLLAAADRIQSTYADDPALGRRSLTEIGHGLINLGRPREAERILLDALSAAARDPDTDVGNRLEILALLVSVQDSPASLPALRQSTAKIEALALDPQASDAAVADALARAGGALARLGDFERANHVLDQAEALLAQMPDADPSAVENFWRQRGWAAMRAMSLKTARDAFAHATALCVSAPTQFSPLRCAEGELLSAEAELADADGASAAQHLLAAQTVYYAEYAADHPERAVFDLNLAHAELLQEHYASADGLLQKVEQVFKRQGAEFAGDLAQAQLLRARIEARRGHCSDARLRLEPAEQTLSQLPIQSPRQAAALATARTDFEQACPGSLPASID